MMNMFFRICCIILPICFFSRAQVAGQSYLPLAVENATWIITYGVEHFSAFINYAYRVQGDTTLSGTTYKKVYYYDLEDSSSPPYQIEYYRLTALIRDDTVTGRVYGILLETQLDIFDCDTDPPQEVLLYDFALETGDTLRDCMWGKADEYAPTVEQVTIQNIYEAERRVWSIGNEVSIIEGIGNSWGLFFLSLNVHHAAYGPVAMHYCIGTNFECGLHTATNDIVTDQTIVYPNPVTDNLHWKTDVLFESLVIYTSTGLIAEQHTCAGSPTINVSRLPSGLYFLELREANQSMMTRFLKQ